MRNRAIGSITAVVCALVFSSAALAQQASSGAGRAAPNSQFNSHDLSGVWLLSGGGGGAAGVRHLSPWVADKDPELTPEGVKLLASHKPSEGPRAVEPALQNDPQSGGNPPGILRSLIYGRPFQLVMLSDSVFQIFEWYHVWRQIWTDGHTLPPRDEADPWWYGHSAAKWDGDTFVVQTVGLDNRAFMDNWGTAFSDIATVEERWRRVDRDNLELTVTIDDPKTFTKAWTTKKLNYKLQPKGSANGEMMEVIFAPMDEQVFNKNIIFGAAYGNKSDKNTSDDTQRKPGAR